MVAVLAAAAADRADRSNKFSDLDGAGAINAALLAASVLALSDSELAQRLDAWRQRQADAVPETPQDVKT